MKSLGICNVFVEVGLEAAQVFLLSLCCVEMLLGLFEFSQAVLIRQLLREAPRSAKALVQEKFAVDDQRLREAKALLRCFKGLKMLICFLQVMVGFGELLLTVAVVAVGSLLGECDAEEGGVRIDW